MRKLLAALFLLATVFTGSASAIAADFDPAKIMARLEQSIVRVLSRDEVAGTTNSGTGFIVNNILNETYVLTAKHVVDNEFATVIVIFKDKEYSTKIIKRLNCDAALIICQAIPYSKPFLPNLSPDTGTVDAIAAGYGQFYHIDKQKQDITWTYGKVRRAVLDKSTSGMPLFNLNRDLIFGTPTLIFGYSGGPCLDLNYNIIGISVMFDSQATQFTDIRKVWRDLPELNNGRNIRVPYDPTFNVNNLPGQYRLPIDLDDTINNENIAVISARFQDAIIEKEKEMMPFFIMTKVPVTLTETWLKDEALVKIGSTTYRIESAFIGIKGSVPYIYKNTTLSNSGTGLYVYFCNEGWECALFLSKPI